MELSNLIPSNISRTCRNLPASRLLNTAGVKRSFVAIRYGRKVFRQSHSNNRTYRMRLALLICCSVIGLSSGLPKGTFSRNSDGSLHFAVPDEAGLSLVGLHYSINKPLHNVAAGDYNVDIRTKTNGMWVYDNDKVTVNAGDVINYWLLFVGTHGGQQELNLSFTIPAPTTKATTHRTTTHTTKKTTPHTTKKTTPHTTHSTTPHNGTIPDNGTTPTPSHHHTTPKPSPDACTSYPCLIFEDNFDVLDFKKWQHELTASGGGNWEFEMYVNNRSNSYVKEGKLYIKPTLTADIYGEQFLSTGLLDIWGQNPPEHCTGPQFFGCFRQGTGTNYVNPIQSARLRSSRSFNFRYGKVEFEAKMPTGDWIWPALWMLPINNHYGLWPASGEIDIVESRGNKNYKDSKGQPFGNNWIGQTLHWGPYFEQNQYHRTHVEKTASSGSFADDFHKYGIEWDEDHISFFLDDQETLKIDPGDEGFWGLGEFDKNIPNSFNPWKAGNGGKMAPFDREFYLIMNVAVGGTNGFFPDNAINGGPAKPWHDKTDTTARDFWLAKNSWYPTWKDEAVAMQVDSVKVWKLKADP